MKNNCFEISIVIFFTFFINFWGTKLKPFPGKANQKQFKVCQRKYFRNWIWNYLEVKNECSRRLTMDFSFFFSHFSVNKLKMFLGKARQSMQNCVNPKSDIENVLENGLETTLWSKADVLLNLWKRKFSVFCTFLSQEVEIAYCESKAKRSKVFESKVGHGKHFRK